LEFVWALSQVADVYGIDKFAGQDWYAWVSRRLVASQRFDGAWADSNPGPVDTCYALLILRRANVRSGPSRQPDHFVNRRQPDRRSR
jgi:hypothetical protein